MMVVSVFDIFKIGIGPSSSHTVGPMLAAKHFVSEMPGNILEKICAVKIDLYGSLSLTGRGHGTDRAIICGLQGFSPEVVDSEIFRLSIEKIDSEKQLFLNSKKLIACQCQELFNFNNESLPLHPNGMKITAFEAGSQQLYQKIYYSVGGGFVTDQDGHSISFKKVLADSLPYPFSDAAELLDICQKNSMSVAEVVLENEKTIRNEAEISRGLQQIWHCMDLSINNGLSAKGILPGGLKVRRRAADMIDKLKKTPNKTLLTEFDYLSCYALAVNEENAAYGRVVTAPTNGAAGIVPAVFKFYLNHLNGDINKLADYLLTATAIANLFKNGASLSAAEMGCQGEIGVAASMAAAALTAVQGGTVLQVENAAEIAIEHSLGLTCDPIGGLVQIPCIERNAIGASKALTSCQLSLKSDGQHIVSLDQAISAMKKTGHDMHSKYKETSTGGLAISVAAPEC